MAYIKFKELVKYFDFTTEVDANSLPSYAREYVESEEKIVFAYKNSKDYAVFTNKKMILFDRDAMAIYYKKIHVIPYHSISSSAINFMPGKAELLFALDSGYQMNIKFIHMDHAKKENLKKIFKLIMKTQI